jgi:hypothetical protein
MLAEASRRFDREIPNEEQLTLREASWILDTFHPAAAA